VEDNGQGPSGNARAPPLVQAPFFINRELQAEFLPNNELDNDDEVADDDNSSNESHNSSNESHVDNDDSA